MARAVATLLAATVLAVTVLAGCGGGAASTTTTEVVTTTAGAVPSPATSTAEFRRQPTACGAEQPPEPADLSYTEPGDAAVTGPVTVVIATSCGDIEAVLDPAQAPQTVNSFVFLAEDGYFDGTVWHRVFPGFIIQGGDPTGGGRGGPGYTIADELPAEGFVYTRGTLAMANAGTGTTGSQFFVMLADGALPPLYSAFGEVTAGLETLDAIADVPLGTIPGSSDPVPTTPLETVYIESVAVQR